MSIKLTSRIAATVLAATSVLGVGAVTTSAPAFAAGVGTVRTGSNAVPLNVRAQPTTKSKTVAKLRNGQRVALKCWTSGQRVNGNWGATTLWHKVGSGYVSDGYLYTGTNGPVRGEPKCRTSTTSKPPTSTPSATLNSRVNSFVARWNNKYVDYDGAYGAQCVDLFNFYNRDVVRGPWISVSYAKQLYSAAPTSKYTKLGAGSTARKGDVAIWNGNMGGGAGHVAIVLKRVNATTLQVIDQNNPYGHKTWVHNVSTKHLTGYLRPKA